MFRDLFRLAFSSVHLFNTKIRETWSIHCEKGKPVDSMKFLLMFQCRAYFSISAGTDEAFDNSRFIEKKKGNLPLEKVG